MILPTAYRNKRVAVVGLARSGLTAAQALTQAGALVHAWDDTPSAQTSALALGLTLTPITAMPWDRLSALILSPGIPHSWPHPHAAAAAAREAGVPILADVDLLLSTQAAAQVIAITGTNGKSTTTALIAHILQKAQKQAVAGGNIGLPALSLPAYGAEGTYVLELSSYQLERVPNLAAHTAILLNISDDHLDRHGGIDGYIQAKSLIFQKQTAKDWAIVGMDDAPSRGVAERLERAGHAARIVPISVLSSLRGGVYIEDGWLIDALDGSALPIFKLEEASRLPGRHNAQNICAAYAAARQAGLHPATIVEAVLGFPGLAHRQERVSVIDGVAYINDSKATNAHAAERALACYPSLHWILGGRPKAGGIDPLVPHFSRIRGAYLIGEASHAFAETLALNGIEPRHCKTLDIAVKAAKAAAQPGETILLSPACASFDQYPSFEHRGEHFRQLVMSLAPRKEDE